MSTKKTTTKAAKPAAKKPAAQKVPPAPEEPPKRGRPVTTGGTPAKDRQSRLLNDLREAGGDKVAACLSPESINDLETIIAAKQFTNRKGRTQAIAFALHDTAARLRKT
jgi:hypothetical protein